MERKQLEMLEHKTRKSGRKSQEGVEVGSRHRLRKGLIWRGRNRWIKLEKIKKMKVDPPNKLGTEEYIYR